ncbi:DNA methylase N-4/N-6 domain protein [Gordonia bronchialis DSM 43247]|uniref:Methyltransferase n=1 Tax=Gordonia bronchialis (strain ATCC 25592 / DSM 43247 / BCRC 13721 / JCM 3198 / KCTC 3076 / NBRC 16047 / NCTC 10667) TaxID=526226 RepID=D0L6F9_GORB4|nr:site-specific DNA-methyltransferase [Gordonia bronchialis]ACY20716.1 DNA methylase N-4/N-6 domain protein [Gordonia bronchialis DSM 43247]MCC3323489.1 site-specific DNA-methyltransferase [Gordonia bronchialis]QGS25533.1 site-specific DNA-methyltransferase [Gordonia bronchialis]STQ63545.1 Modification methylase RsrI [Gordonia bronchialis]
MSSQQIRRNRIVIGDALTRLQELPDSSIDCVVASPPYFRLRDYNADGQLGLESHVDQCVDNLAAISEQAGRILVPTGTFWLNVGDTYSGHASQGAARKSLLMAPERLALRLHHDGWLIRNKIVWAKPNPVPSSVRDRLNCTYEVIYVLARQPHYFFDLDAIREPLRTARSSTRANDEGQATTREAWRGPNGMAATGLQTLKAQGRAGHPLGKNPGDVWTITPGGYRGAHHAIFPLRLAERMIAAGCPEARCTRCRRPWTRRVIRALGGTATRAAITPTCQCNADHEPGLVLDPFMGSGTTAIAAENLKRDWYGIELNPDFAAAARDRIATARRHRLPPPPERSAA